MLSLLMGLVAAVAWALHDLQARRLSQQGAVLPLMLVVAGTGLLALVAPMALWADFGAMGGRAYGLAGLAGLAYVLGMAGLYVAFQLAPVRVVAPLLGAYPVLSLGLAALQGRSVALIEWLAVLAVVGGIALVTLLSRTDEGAPVPLARALAWAGAGALGFALTFGLAQAAARAGDEVAVIFVARVVGFGVLALIMALRRPSMARARAQVPMLTGMGLCDALAIGLVTASAALPHPEYGAIASALFGVLTILLARVFLGERVAALQWMGITMVFVGIGTLAGQG
jgi:drug/metabolite transporter (DMT)-like permease